VKNLIIPQTTENSSAARMIPPPEAFARQAQISSMAAYRELYEESIRTPERFWDRLAKEHLTWFEPWRKVLQWRPPVAQWFLGGQLNAAHICLDRHLDTPKADQAALIWEGEPEVGGQGGEERVFSYRQLHETVCRFANVLKGQGIGKGDRVAIYLPILPETVIAMLACARIGAIHVVIYAGFSARSLAERIENAQARLVITADGGFRRGTMCDLKRVVDESLALSDGKGQRLAQSVERVIVVRRTGASIPMTPGRDLWYEEVMARAGLNAPAERMDSEDPLFILYTSGASGRPKGVVHTTAGFLLGAKVTAAYVFDLRDGDRFWCTADPGWISGHSYVVYGPLANGATTFLFEGAPSHPAPDRCWRMIQKHGLTIFHTTPTTIRAFMRWGSDWVRNHDLRSLRLLGSVGEPIDPDTWHWYHETIGGGRCPIVDTWWQTETGAIMISPLPGAIPAKPGSAALPFFGVLPEVVDEQGRALAPHVNGRLVIRKPWPSMIRGIWGDPQRFKETFWNELDGGYFTGDGCHQDEDGYFWMVGRLDDSINVAGHRIGAAEIESALVRHPAVAEAAVVGRTDDLKGQALVAFVTLAPGTTASALLREQLRNHVTEVIGALAQPDEIRMVDALPRTRSGKVMRRYLQEVADGVVEGAPQSTSSGSFGMGTDPLPGSSSSG
jgi:acetyl-CoA synthetase